MEHQWLRSRFYRYFAFGIAATIMMGASLGKASTDAVHAFVLGAGVAISRHVAAAEPGAVVLPIREEVLEYIAARQGEIRVVYCSVREDRPCQTSELQTLPIEAAHVGRDQILLPAAEPGTYVVATNAFTSDFPIVTHWKQSLNDGRGGQQELGNDPLGRLQIDPRTGKTLSLSRLQFAIFDTDNSHSLIYDTANYALFGPDSPGQVPDYEQYVGENYSILGMPSDFLATHTHQILSVTRWPIIHRNGSHAALDAVLQEDLPAYQVVHAAIIGDNPSEQSLATVLVPPFWKRQAVRPYPILFYGFYDIHYTFAAYSQNAAKLMDAVMAQNDQKFITVFWNGGGAYGPRGMHRSAYDGASTLFARAGRELSADPQGIVAVGCSRGGGTAITVAANPYHDNYRVQYALAYSPGGSQEGERMRFVGSFTYGGLPFVTDRFTGYRYAWHENWRDDQGRTAGEVLSWLGLGVTNPSEADALSLQSDFILDPLARKGTRVLLSLGTSDAYQPFFQNHKLFENATAKGIPARIDIGYRFGHCGMFAQHSYAETENAIRQVLSGELAFSPGTRLLRRQNDRWDVAEEFTPSTDRYPVFAELPNLVIRDGSFKMLVGGGFGAQYRLEIAKIDDGEWGRARQVVKIGTPMVISDKIARATGTVLKIGTKLHEWQWSYPLDVGHYAYEFFYRYSDADPWQPVTKTTVTNSDVHRYPVFEVLDTAPLVSGTEMMLKYTSEMRGFGFASE